MKIGSGLRILRFLFIAAAAAGMAISGYLLYAHRVPSEQASALFKFCSVGGFDCGLVNESEYSVFLGLPVAAWGVAFYLTLLLSSIYRNRTFLGAHIGSPVDAVVLLLSAAGALATVPLFIVSAFFLNAFCLYCVFSWICNILLFIFILLDIIYTHGSFSPAVPLRNLLQCFADFRTRSGQFIILSVFAALSLGLAAVLSIYPRVGGVDAAPGTVVSEEERLLNNFRRAVPGEVSLAGVPVLYGNPQGKVTIVEFFNFDCSVCREASRVIKSVMDLFPGKVKLHIMHYPLDGTCNKSIAKIGNGLSCKASIIALGLQKTGFYAPFVGHILGSGKALSREIVLDALRKIDMDIVRLKKITDERTAEKILVLQMMQGDALGITGTPTFVINGKTLPAGLPPPGVLEKLLRMEVGRVYGVK